MGVVVSAVVHLGVLAFLLWAGQVAATRLTMGVPGLPGGGGGGGSGSSVRYIQLPPQAASPTPRIAAPAPPPVVEEEEAELVLPEVERVETEVVEARVAADYGLVPVRVDNAGQGTGEGAGTGTGSGGGVGSGEGTGIGSGVGPGTGGDGGDALAPEPRSVVYPFEEPPASVRGRQYSIHFWVDRRGRVTKVEITPRIPDGDFRRKLEERMRQWVFYPARTVSGEAVPGELVVTYEP